MNDLGLLKRQFFAEAKMLLRNPMSVGFTILFPVMFLVIFGSLTGGGIHSLSDTPFGQMRYLNYYLSGIATFGVIGACFMNLTILMVMRRDEGILRRKRATPLPTWVLLGGIVAAETALAVTMVIVTTAVAMGIYGTPFPHHPFMLFGVVLLGAATFCALGMAMTVIIPNQDAGPAIVNLVALPLLFLSGAFFPITNSTIRSIAQVLPIARLQNAMNGSYAPPTYSCELVKSHCPPGALVHHASGPHIVDLAILGLWLIAGLVTATRFFRWESKAH